ncbi:hypothetical protein [Altericroceibacterium xinjiangense]|uniref:hypothetical protein n=1 Tax=Altericroceibacterium xinjiangense TaxID=762261 RepID=UPI0013DF3CAD|nr:hypothetical protein [Altericroceibacterium xinjiangense]
MDHPQLSPAHGSVSANPAIASNRLPAAAPDINLPHLEPRLKLGAAMACAWSASGFQ